MSQGVTMGDTSANTLFVLNNPPYGGARRSTMDELVQATATADKVLVV